MKTTKNPELIATGAILPRDYGIIVNSGYNKLFFTPASYAMAKVLLEEPETVEERVRDKAQRIGQDFEEAMYTFRYGLAKRKAENLIEHGGSSILEDVTLYGDTYSASVRAKGKRRGKNVFYDVSLKYPRNGKKSVVLWDTYSDAEDYRWGRVNALHIMTPHIVALQIALYNDFVNSPYLSAENNLTGLLPSERLEGPSMPFRFVERGLNNEEKKELDRVVTDIVWDYAVNNKKLFHINKEILDNEAVYAKELKDELKKGNARFAVHRNREQTKKRAEISTQELELYGAINALETRVKDILLKQGFKYQGCDLEFKGTSYETVGQRFVKDNVAYSMVTDMDKNLPPVIVKKALGELSGNWIDSIDNLANHPLKNAPRYDSIDDVTRKEARTTIIGPEGMSSKGIYIPSRLARAYARARD